MLTSLHHNWVSVLSEWDERQHQEPVKLGHHQQFPLDAHPAATQINLLFVCLFTQAVINDHYLRWQQINQQWIVLEKIVSLIYKEFRKKETD